ncbi:MAG: hypothetical protein ACWGQW_17605 [bacterium]
MSGDLYAEMAEAQAEAKDSSLQKPNRMVQILDDMPDKDRKAVLRALWDDEMSSKVIMNILVKNDWKISYDQVRRFRSGTCKVPDRYKKNGEDSK